MISLGLLRKARFWILRFLYDFNRIPLESKVLGFEVSIWFQSDSLEKQGLGFCFWGDFYWISMVLIEINEETFPTRFVRPPLAR